MFPGDVTSYGDSSKYTLQFVDSMRGRDIYRICGVGLITDAPKTVIDVKAYPIRSTLARDEFPPVPFLLPAGAQILSASIRLPGRKESDAMHQWGMHLAKGATLTGTTGDVLKLTFNGNPTTFAAANTASITSASNTYGVGASARVSRAFGQVDNASSILNTLSTPTTINLVVANTGNSGVGSGISISTQGESALVAVDVVYEMNSLPVAWKEIPVLGRAAYS